MMSAAAFAAKVLRLRHLCGAGERGLSGWAGVAGDADLRAMMSGGG
jgi:hypothetical protein